jgi:hypothetical protein
MKNHIGETTKAIELSNQKLGFLDQVNEGHMVYIKIKLVVE